MKIFKIVGLLLAAGVSGAVSCACSKTATDEIRNKEDEDIDELSEMDNDSTIPNDTVEEI